MSRRAGLLAIATVPVPFAVAASLVVVRDWIPSTTIALIVAVTVVGLAGIADRPTAALVGLSGAAGFDLFQTRPYGSFAITRAADIETTVLLLATGLLVGEISARSHRHRSVAADSSRNVHRLHALAEMVARGDPVVEVVACAADEVVELLGLRSCAFDHSLAAGPGPFVERSGAVTWGQIPWKLSTYGLPAKPISLTIENQGWPLGRFVLAAEPGRTVAVEDLLVAVALADQVGAAIAAQGAPATA